MLKKALKTAIGPAFGVMIGGVIIPRLIHPEFYNGTYPGILAQAGVALIGGYAGSLLVVLLIRWIKD